jgi:hypothetical protein
MTQVRIVSGSYRAKNAAGMTFELVDQFRQTGKNSFVTVRNGGNLLRPTSKPLNAFVSVLTFSLK